VSRYAEVEHLRAIQLRFRGLDIQLDIRQLSLCSFHLLQGSMHLERTGTGQLTQRAVDGASTGEGILCAPIAMLQPLQPALRQIVIKFQIEGHSAALLSLYGTCNESVSAEIYKVAKVL